MILNARSKYVIKRNIEWYGRSVDFWRAIPNKYKEESDHKEVVATIRCLYHASSLVADRTRSDAARTNAGRTQYLLALYDTSIQRDDICIVNRTQYRVKDICNIDMADEVMEISIEEVR